MADSVHNPSIRSPQTGSVQQPSKSRPGGTSQDAGGPSFSEVLQTFKDSTEAQQQTLQQADAPEQIQTTKDIDRMMNRAEESFEAVQKASKTLNAAITAYRKSGS